MKKSFRRFISVFYLLSVSSMGQIDTQFESQLKAALSDTTRISLLCKKAEDLASQNPELSLEYSQRGLTLSKKHTEYAYKCYKSIGVAQENLGNYGAAISNYFNAVNALEKIKSSGKDQYKGVLLDLIGGIYTIQKNYDKAIEYRTQALEIFKKRNDKSWMAVIRVNLANIYYYMEEFNKAVPVYLEAASDFEELNDKASYAIVTNNIGAIYFEMKQYPEALKYFTRAYQAHLKTNNILEIATSLNNIGESYGKLRKTDSAIHYCKQSLQVSEKANLIQLMEPAYQNLADLYEYLDDYKNAMYYHKLYSLTKDSIFNEESSKQFHEMSVKYETDKKEKENQLLNQTIKIKEVESSRQQLAIVLIGTILLVVGFVVFVLVRQNSLKNKINKQLAEKNQIIEYQHKNITDSIHYSKRIQEAILPPLPLWYKALPESFIIYKPKDILSGDFYWLEKVKDTIFFAAADCTGHGVPGAMVSVVCSTALNRSVKEFNLKEPGAILDKVRELVIQTFEKSESDVKDGMDISLIALQTSSGSDLRTIKWAGANNPLWYLENGQPREITGDKQPVGKIDDPHPFTTHSLELKKGDAIYIFTDGYADQFGGIKGKKLKYKTFRDTILQNIDLDVKAQKRNIENAFNAWKGNLEQVDDVCVIGVKL